MKALTGFSTMMLIGPILVLPAAVRAAPAVDVTAFWDVRDLATYDPQSGQMLPLPPGFQLSCFGDATATLTGCLMTALLHRQGAGAYDVETIGGATLTNTGGITSPLRLIATTDFSAFYPGSLGITIGSPTGEGASYNSTVSDSAGGGDHHYCSIGTLGYSGDLESLVTPTSCEVSNPDISSAGWGAALPAPGDSISITSQEMISAVLIPEPGALSLLAVGLACCVGMRRRKQPP